MHPTKKEFRIGLDIGTRFIKALELYFDGNVTRITKFRSKEIDFPLDNDKTTSALGSLLENFHPSVKEVNISLSAPSAIVRFINMPKMSETDLKNSLRFEAEKYIPFNIKEVVTDAAILGPAPEDKAKMRVLFAAAKREAVDSKIAMLKNFGLSASVIDIDSFACFNAFSNSSGKLDESKSTALLNIGYTQANLIVCEGDNPCFIRDIQIGARDMTKLISERLGADEKEADRIVHDPKDKKTEVYDIVRSVLTGLFDEIRLSFGYYENQHGKSINEIYISGGLARLEGIFKHFEENFEVAAMPWNPFLKFEVDSNVNAKALERDHPFVVGQFAVASGLAIRRNK